MTQTQDLKGDAASTPAVVERLLRRSLLLLTRDRSTAQDWIDLAELADAVGVRNVAQLARNIGQLRLGFGENAPVAGDAPTTSIDRAVDELRRLMGTPSHLEHGATAIVVDPIQACHELCGLLAAPLDTNSERTLAALFETIRGLPPADPREHVDGNMIDLLAAFAVSEMRNFLRQHHDLAFPPCGSAAHLHAAARLSSGGLGPYLAHVGNIVRGSQDVIGLIALAGKNHMVATVEQWAAPVAANLPEGLLGDLVEDFADLGMIKPLEGLYAAMLRRTDTLSPLRRTRDAALDLGDLGFALRIQEQIVARWPYDAAEWRNLGDMHATAQDKTGAEAAFSRALKLAPADANIEARLAALVANDFDAFLTLSGFSSRSTAHRAA